MGLLGELPGANPGQVLGLFAALVLGTLIGLERQYRKHPAGLHTNALVALLVLLANIFLHRCERYFSEPASSGK